MQLARAKRSTLLHIETLVTSAIQETAARYSKQLV
jgi:hypothetical protein